MLELIPSLSSLLMLKGSHSQLRIFEKYSAFCCVGQKMTTQTSKSQFYSTVYCDLQTSREHFQRSCHVTFSHSEHFCLNSNKAPSTSTHVDALLFQTLYCVRRLSSICWRMKRKRLNSQRMKHRIAQMRRPMGTKTPCMWKTVVACNIVRNSAKQLIKTLLRNE